MLDALPGELAPRDVDFGAVVLVVPGDVQDPVCACPALGDVTDPAGVHRSEVAGEDDELGVGSEWRDTVPVELDVEVGENLHAHDGADEFYLLLCFMVCSSSLRSTLVSVSWTHLGFRHQH